MDIFYIFFFFFKQKTAYEITRRDWSSDVCSSDLWSPAAFYSDVAGAPRAVSACLGDEPDSAAPQSLSGAEASDDCHTLHDSACRTLDRLSRPARPTTSHSQAHPSALHHAGYDTRLRRGRD